MKRVFSLMTFLILCFLFTQAAFSQDFLDQEEKPLEIVKKPVKAVRKMTPKKPVDMPFYVFNNTIYPPVKNFAPSGYMADVPDIKLTGSYKVVKHEGYPALKVTFLALGPSGWAGLMWQNPPNNWGDLDGGYNLSKATKLTFWAKGEQGGEIVEFKIGGTLSNYPDSANISTGEITLSDEWTKYTLDLSDAEIHYVSAGFGMVLKQDTSPEGCIFYLDDIKYEE